MVPMQLQPQTAQNVTQNRGELDLATMPYKTRKAAPVASLRRYRNEIVIIPDNIYCAICFQLLSVFNLLEI